MSSLLRERSSVCDSLLAGWQNAASAEWLLLPGMKVRENLYLSVFSFRLKSLGFGMSSIARSPRSFKRGWWSTATIKSGCPSTKYLAFSRDQATARLSPSIGAYLDSAGEQNLDPTNVTFQPVEQQMGDLPGQVQCFCIRTNPRPTLLQSVRSAVVLDGS